MFSLVIWQYKPEIVTYRLIEWSNGILATIVIKPSSRAALNFTKILSKSQSTNSLDLIKNNS